MKREIYIVVIICLGLLSTKCEKLSNEPEVNFDITNSSTKNYKEIIIYTTNSEELFDSLIFELKVDEKIKLSWKDFSRKGDGSFLIKTDDLKTRGFGYYSGSYIPNLNNNIEIKEDTILVEY